ncbi:ribonuclease P protein component [Segetibacter sp. 3557_3]|nr:ribonuclease P protein component [Segetibacter sp. 3557_3]
MHHSYNSTERLKSRKLIEDLFKTGTSLNGFPVKLLYKVVDDINQPLLQAGVSVGAKRFKKAVDRIRIKRLLRESYRLQKYQLQDQLYKRNIRVVLFLIYIGPEMPEYDLVYAKTGLLIARLTEHFTPKTPLREKH